MNVYVWESGYGGRHVISVAESIDEAREKVRRQVRDAHEIIEKMEDAEYMGIEWFDLQSKLEEINGGGEDINVTDINASPTQIIDILDTSINPVCLKLGNDV